MSKKTLILTESQIKKVIDNLLTEQVFTNFDSNYDYKLDGNMWYSTLKGQDKWLSLKNSPSAIQKLNQKYGKDVPIGKSDSLQPQPTQNVSNLLFKNESEGNAFRSWFIKTYPDHAKKMNLSPTGPFNNSYINNAYNLKLSNGKIAGEEYKLVISGTPSIKKDEDFKESGLKNFLMKILPSNVVHVLYPTNLSNSSITKAQKNELGKAIKKSMRRIGTDNRGFVTYEDWGPEYVEWFKNDKPLSKRDLFIRSLSDPKFQIATTVGQGLWKNLGDKIVYEDKYDWNKKGEGLSRYRESVGVDTSNLSYPQAIIKLQKEAGLDLYRAIRELQHRESPVVSKDTPAPKMVFSFDKGEFEKITETSPRQS
jgi:hypothetical protein